MISGSEIKKRRKALGLSQQTLATAAGVSRSAVYDWERGTYSPEGENAKSLAKVLEISIAYLMGETDNPSPIKKGSKSALSYMREETGLSLEEASKLINLPAKDIEMMEENEHLSNEELKQKLIKAYVKYFSQKDGDKEESEKDKKGESEEDLETLLNMLAAEDPDLVLQFRHVAKNIDKIHPKDKEFLATLFKAALGKIELEDQTDEY